MLFVPDWIIRLASKKDSEPNSDPKPETTMGGYFKFYYCGCCGYAIHDRTIKNVECCRACGNEPMVKTVGRWEYNPFNYGILSGSFAVKFHPKNSEACEDSMD